MQNFIEKYIFVVAAFFACLVQNKKDWYETRMERIDDDNDDRVENMNGGYKGKRKGKSNEINVTFQNIYINMHVFCI